MPPWTKASEKCISFFNQEEGTGIFGLNLAVSNSVFVQKSSVFRFGCSFRFSRTQTSAVSEHDKETGHIPIWSKVKVIDRDPH